MLVKTKFMGNFVALFGEEKEVELEPDASLRDLAMAVCNSKDCYEALFTDDGKPRLGIEIMKLGKRVQLLHTADSRLSEGDVITFSPPLPM